MSVCNFFVAPPHHLHTYLARRAAEIEIHLCFDDDVRGLLYYLCKAQDE